MRKPVALSQNSGWFHRLSINKLSETNLTNNNWLLVNYYMVHTALQSPWSKPPSTCKFERSLLHVILCQITGKRSPWKHYFSPCEVLDFFPQNSVGTMCYKNYLCNEVDYNAGEIYPSLLNSSVGSCTSHFDLTNERRMKETGPVAWHKCPITQSCELRRDVLNHSKHDLTKFIKTLVGGLAGVWTCVLALGKLALFQLS